MITHWRRYLLLSLLITITVSCGDKTVITTKKRTVITAVVPHKTMITETIPVVGSVESLQSPTLSAEIAGQIIAINTDIGKQAQVGEPLLEIDDALERIALDRATLDVARLSAQISNQKMTVDRFTTLVKRQSQTESNLDAAIATLKTQQAQLAQAKLAIAQARYNLNKTRVTAPIAGTVSQRMVSVGDYVTPGKPLLTLSTQQQLRIRIKVSENYGSQLKVGQHIILRSPLSPNTPHRATIAHILPHLDAISRAIGIIATVDSTRGLKPGASVNGHIIIAQRPQALTLPSQAVVRRKKGNVVFVIEHDHVTMQLVQVGSQSGDRIEIIEGIHAKTRVANQGAGFLSDGAAIQIQAAAQ